MPTATPVAPATPPAAGNPPSPTPIVPTQEKETKPGTEGASAAPTSAAGSTQAALPIVPAKAGDPAASTEATTEAPKGAPEVYELKLPENAVLDAAAVERTAAIARVQGLSNDAAQAALELANTEAVNAVAAAADRALDAHRPGGAEWTKIVEGYRQAALDDANLGKTPEERTAAIQRGHGVVEKYVKTLPAEDGKAFKAYLNDSGLGDHPAAVRFFAWLGKAAGDGSFVQPNAEGQGKQRLADILYGESMPANAG